MTSAHIARRACIGFIAGIAAASHLLDESGLLAAAAAASLAVSVLLIGTPRRFVPICIVPLFFCIGATYIAVRHAHAAPPAFPEAPESFTGSVIYNDPYPEKQRMVVRIREPEAFADRRLFVYTRRYPLYEIGSRVSFRCAPVAPEPIEDFAFDRYVEKEGVSGLCYYSPVWQAEGHDPVRYRLFAVKSFFHDYFVTAFHEPVSSVLKALTLRETREVDQRVRDAFSQAGVAHVLAISGLHISILMLFIEELLLLLGASSRARIILLGVGMLGYLLIIGFAASAVRAVVMGLAVVGAKLVHRPYDGMHILILTAALMALVTPLAVVFDIGFQLSFLALAGIAVTNSWWRRHLVLIPERFGVRSIVALTMSAQVFTWPLVIYYFGIASIVAPIANIIIMPFVTLILLGGFAAPIVSLVPFFGEVVRWPLFFVTTGVIRFVEFTASLPDSYLRIDFSAQWLGMAYAAMLIAYTAHAYIRQQRRS